MKSNPGGLGDDPAVESNAVIDVDADLPDECRGRQIFISQANGFESTWKIEALAPLPGGGTRLTLDRPARQAILRMPRFASDGRSFTASGTANLLPGDNCRIGNAWRRIVAVEQAAAGSVFSLALRGCLPPDAEFREAGSGPPACSSGAPDGRESSRFGDRAPATRFGCPESFTGQ